MFGRDRVAWYGDIRILLPGVCSISTWFECNKIIYGFNYIQIMYCDCWIDEEIYGKVFGSDGAIDTIQVLWVVIAHNFCKSDVVLVLELRRIIISV